MSKHPAFSIYFYGHSLQTAAKVRNNKDLNFPVTQSAEGPNWFRRAPNCSDELQMARKMKEREGLKCNNGEDLSGVKFNPVNSKIFYVSVSLIATRATDTVFKE